MISRYRVQLLVVFSAFLFASGFAKTLDPYKVLGVDKSASQRDIQKAFHKLSLKYHPDKNKDKGAQEKFAEINNAYDILSDEEKKKNYDLYGDEKGNPGFDGGNFGGGNGYTHFTSGGPGGWQSTGGQGNSKSYSFSFGGNPGGGGGGGFDFGNIFSSMFGGGMGGGNQYSGFSGGNQYSGSGGNQYSGFSGSAGHSSRHTSESLEDINSQIFNKGIKDQGMTWLLLFYTPSAKGYNALESITQDVANSLQGAVKAGKINCQIEKTLCKDLGVVISKSSRIYVYSYGTGGGRGSLVEYTGDFDAKSLKSFCQDHLPRFSKRVDLRRFDFPSQATDSLPQVLLLSTKKDTPAMWRAVSGLFRKRFTLYDAEVHDDALHPMLKRLGVVNFPAIIGRTVNGEEHVLKTGITVKDLKSGVNDLKVLLENFEKKNKKIASSQAKRPSQTESQPKGVPYLASSNVDAICGDKTAVCIIGVFRSSKAKEKLEAVMTEISQKTFVRRQNYGQSPGDSVSYSLLDASKQSSFLNSFDKSGFKSVDKLLVAYKPRRGKFAAFTDEITMEEAEKFVSSVLNGDVSFTKIRQKPTLK